MFPIELRLSNNKDRCEQIIRESAELLAVPERAILSVVVAEDNNEDYGASIEECRGFNGSSTHSSGGAGKTVPFRNKDGTIQSEIVYPSTTLTALFIYSKESPTYLLSRYAILHEFGHAIDFNARSVVFPSVLLENESTIAEYANYYGTIILSELAACFISGAYISKTAL